MKTQKNATFQKSEKTALLIILLAGFLTAILSNGLSEIRFYFYSNGDLSFLNKALTIGISGLIYTVLIYIVYYFSKKTSMPFVGQIIFSIFLGAIILPVLLKIIIGLLIISISMVSDAF